MADQRPRILLLENIHPVAQEMLEQAGCEVTLETKAFGEEELTSSLRSFDLLGIRSKTQISAKALDANKHLLCIGAFCIGTNQIDLERANAIGVPVFNAPYSNTRSVAELVICEIIALARQLTDRSAGAHSGVWQKTADGAHEVRGKTLGIVGFGHIGSQLSVLAEALGLRVIFYDILKRLPLGNASSCETLSEVLRQADFVSLHVPETELTKDMIGAEELAQMKAGSCLINASRGTVVVIPALVAALKEGRLAGAAIDVFPEEPASTQQVFRSELQGLSNVILTPHVGGSTEEAQESIGREVADSFLGFLRSGSTSGAVQFPMLDLQAPSRGHRILNVHRNVPGVLKAINGIVSELGANISAQHLATDPQIGYLAMDVEKADAAAVCARISQLDTTMKAWVLGALKPKT